MPDVVLRAQLCDIGRRLWQRGLIGAAEGNLSVRVSPRRILLTPSGVSKGHLRPSDLVLTDLEGEHLEGGTPSSEVAMHTRIYALRSDVQAVVHAHPPHGTALAVSGETIPDYLMPESMAVLGSVATVPFAMPSSKEVPDAMEPLIHDHKAFLLSHHGAVTFGKSLIDAYDRMETLERIAHIVWLTRSLGGAQPLPERAVELLSRSALNGNL